ncbi:MAG: hypothetical protein ACI8UD_003621 [Planctomycetota bacterium]|jgi:hypothetical protein
MWWPCKPSAAAISLLTIPGLSAGCTRIPTLDVSLVEADLSIPLPPAVRPLTFYA